MANLEILLENKSIPVIAKAGSNLLKLLQDENLFVTADCNGNGTCGKCKVKISDKDKRTFTEVLSCRTEVSDGMVILLSSDQSLSLQETTFLKESDHICDSNHAWSPANLAVAVDLGTTTIAASLIRLSDGQVLASCQEWNCQIPYGADVLSRIHYIMQEKDGLSRLSSMVKEQIKRMIHTLTPENSGTIPVMISGNTIMQHIYAEIDPSSMAAFPYTPATLFGENIYPELTPCISAFIGGDITAGLYDSELFEKDGNWLFVDIGTNGEMALGGKEGFLCVSVATGPAFEGAQISCGCYGRPGAISHVNWDRFSQKFTFETIGHELPNGICGSGLLDLLAILTELGIITNDGRILSPYELEEAMEKGLLDEDVISYLEMQLGIDFLQEDTDGNGIFYLYSDSERPVYLCTSDVHNLQLAKASVRAGIELLLKEKSLSVDDLDGIVLAGGFGAHLSITNIEKSGMLPAASSPKIIQAGNTSLRGTGKYLSRCFSDTAFSPEKENQSVRHSGDLLHIQSLCKYIELADSKEFAQLFIQALSFQPFH